MAFAHIYKCPVHGETINVYISEEVDIINDEVYQIPICNKPDCYREVTPVMIDGKHAVRPLTDEEMDDELYWSGDYDDEEDYFE